MEYSSDITHIHMYGSCLIYSQGIRPVIYTAITSYMELLLCWLYIFAYFTIRYICFNPLTTVTAMHMAVQNNNSYTGIFHTCPNKFLIC